jgi:hypothetical protein
MAELKEFVVGFVGVIIGIVVAISLLPVLTGSIETANLTGTNALMIGLVPTLVAVGVLLYAIKALF